MTASDLLRKINAIISNSYAFYEYHQFTAKIKKLIHGLSAIDASRKLQKQFDDTLLVIDEIHNLRSSTALATIDNENAYYLEILVRNVHSMRLLFLSGTPMLNNTFEIVWLLNIMNMNDKRAIIPDISIVFDENGYLTEDGP